MKHLIQSIGIGLLTATLFVSAGSKTLTIDKAVAVSYTHLTLPTICSV